MTTSSAPFSAARMLYRGALLGFGACCSLACQGTEAHDLGFTQTSRDLNTDEATETTTPFFTSNDDFVGSWTGDAEAALGLSLDSDGRPSLYQFPSGSTEFALDLDHATDLSGNPTLTGTITFGAGAPPPPPTDPEVGYPSGVNYAQLLSYGKVDAGLPNNVDSRFPPFEGFPYSIEKSSQLAADPLTGSGNLTGVADGVLVLRFSTSEIIDGWCALQTPQQNQYGIYTPFPAGGGSFESRGDGTNARCQVFGDQDLCEAPEAGVDRSAEELLNCLDPNPPVIAELSCDKTFLAPYCECTATSCRALGVEYETEQNSKLLVRRVGDRLVGAFQNEIFLNARNLTVPMGRVSFVALPNSRRQAR